MANKVIKYKVVWNSAIAKSTASSAASAYQDAGGTALATTHIPGDGAQSIYYQMTAKPHAASAVLNMDLNVKFSGDTVATPLKNFKSSSATNTVHKVSGFITPGAKQMTFTMDNNAAGSSSTIKSAVTWVTVTYDR